MTDIIRLLPDNIANQIAAGEVIQRPASAVKEMLENAIDADATSIHLIIKDAGKELIQVNDNGKGMSPTDARTCFERHATSKIQSIDDLFAIRTMGFRGEALASIAAVAQVELKTRREEDEVGTSIHIENSTVRKQEPCQANKGTSLSVKNLFYNVPARRNFLKSNTVELRHIIDEFTRVAMAFPHISFKLTNNQTDVFNLEAGKLKQRILGLLGNQYNTKLVPVQEETEPVSIRGFVGSPEAASKTRGNQYFFVNNRFIKSAYLNHAVSQAYKELISKEEYPFFVLFIDIHADRIDINVHPTKQEIKFEDERIVYSYVNAAIKHALSKYSIAPSLDFSLNADIESLPSISQPFTVAKQEHTKNEFLYQSFSQKGKAHFLDKKEDIRNWKELYKIQHEYAEQNNTNPSSHLSTPSAPTNNEEEQIALFTDTPFQQDFLQIALTYILATTKNGFLLIDQHLAHQRILYERMENAQLEQIPIQRLLIPHTFELIPADALIISSLLDDLKILGYLLESFGQNTFILHGVPADVKSGNEKASIESLVELYKHEVSTLKLDKREKLIRTLAKQKAIAYGTKLSNPEMHDLFQQLLRCEQPQLSPEGEKIFVKMNQEHLADLIKQA